MKLNLKEPMKSIKILDTRYTLIADNMKMDDIVPGQIDDTYFLFAVQNLCKNPGNINNYLLRMEVIITLMAIMN